MYHRQTYNVVFITSHQTGVRHNLN